MKGSLIIVGFFVLGIIVGVWDGIPASFLASDVSYYALCCLMFCVGISIGCDTSILKSFRKVNPRLMMLPVMTILGTLAGCAAASLILGHRQISDCLAIGSGFGYYSLSSIFITQYQVPSWEPSPCLPTSSVRFSPCLVRPCWRSISASWRLSAWVEPPRWIPRCLSSPAIRARASSSFPSSTASA